MGERIWLIILKENSKSYKSTENGHLLTLMKLREVRADFWGLRPERDIGGDWESARQRKGRTRALRRRSSSECWAESYHLLGLAVGITVIFPDGGTLVWQGGKTRTYKEDLICPMVLGLDLTTEANTPYRLVCLRNHPRSLLKCVFLVSSPEALILLNMEPGDFDGGAPGTTILKCMSE